jgi:hypothetical protein
MALVSPGVQVNVIDESFYTPAGAGTVPMIFVASASNKANSAGTGVARGTLKSNAGRPFLLTSQRELGELFGDPLFYSDQSGNMIHGGELNEYGLQTAYSLLGVTNRVFVTRADFDLGKLEPSAVAPGGEPRDGSYWLDTAITSFGALEWNSAGIRAGGQSFNAIEPVVIIQESRAPGGVPLASIGSVGEYAIVATTNVIRLWYKNRSANWVLVGSPEWSESWPTVRSVGLAANITSGSIRIGLNDPTAAEISFGGGSIDQLVNAINTVLDPLAIGISAGAVDGRLEIYSDGNPVFIGSGGAGTLFTALGIVAGIYQPPIVSIAPHTRVPEFKTNEENRPTGSIWIKTTPPNAGGEFRVKQYNSDTQLWRNVDAPIYSDGHTAIRQLDRSGGGANLRPGDLYVKVNVAETDPSLGTFKLYRRIASGETRITSGRILNGNTLPTIPVESSFTIFESRLDGTMFGPVIVDFASDFSGTEADANTIAAAINSKTALVNTVAEVDDLNRIIIKHRTGGEIRLVDDNGILNKIGFDPTLTANLYELDTNVWVASLWSPLVYEASATEPFALTADGEVWYNSVVDEVDIMVHNGTTWVGYKSSNGGFVDTDPTGPIVSATEPTEQRDGSPLEDGDLWIDTSDIDNYPMIYRYRKTGNDPINDIQEWILLDKTDQTTENGVLFADARWSTDGGSTLSPYPAASIESLLSSDYLDPDAPDPALYPRGMILWNLRRSGFNVKRFERNYINTGQLNGRFSDQSMSDYYPHRWVTDSPNQEDGSGSFGRHAQRSSVVKALKAMVNSNQDIRDEEARQFNLIACPGYPELIQPMITLNFDRRLTSFVVGDCPFRLTPDATSLNEWATNVRRALETNEVGLTAFDEYFAIYYGSGFTSDNVGNNVVVPPSHMALRVLVLNDQVAYPWFAPAGTRRGGVTNATSSGYITKEGEFVSVALNTGQRDTLYSNNINPITFLAGSGLLVFGQKTRARNASALDRINVARLIVYMRVQLERLARPYLFEPNDQITRNQIKAATEAFCLELVSLRALYDFLVVCDESNNTPARVDRNELYLDIAIEPVKAIEFIYIPLRVKNTGAIAAGL